MYDNYLQYEKVHVYIKRDTQALFKWLLVNWRVKIDFERNIPRIYWKLVIDQKQEQSILETVMYGRGERPSRTRLRKVSFPRKHLVEIRNIRLHPTLTDWKFARSPYDWNAYWNLRSIQPWPKKEGLPVHTVLNRYLSSFRINP